VGRLWVVASMLLAPHVVRADAFSCTQCQQTLEHHRPPACPTNSDGVRGWIRATALAIVPPSYRCEAAEPIEDPDVLLGTTGTHPDAATGCVITRDAPACLGRDSSPLISVGIDGASREVAAVVGLAWKVCGLVPGRHRTTMCTLRGAVTCDVDITANAATWQSVVPVDAELRVHVDSVYAGDASLVGRELSFHYQVDPQFTGSLHLPSQLDLVWTTTDAIPTANVCAPPASIIRPPPIASNGCARCDSTGGAGGAATFAVMGLLLLRRRR